MKSSGELLKGNSDLLLLSALAAGPLHGYALARKVEERSGGAIVFNDGVLYPTLHRLETDRCVTSKWGEVEGRRRRVYSITTAGRKLLAARKKEWSLFASALGSVLGVHHA